MAKTVGIDFGTTNSLISVVLSNQVKSYLNDSRMPHPSTVGYEGGKTIVGTEAKERISDASSSLAENLVRSPKAMLGKGNIFISGREITPGSVVTDLMRYLKDDAEKKDPDSGADFSKAIVSIPVSMNGRTRKELRDALLQAGIHVVQFVHEPLAALYAYFKDQENFEEILSLYQGKLALVFDWGGGTLDTTLCQVIDGAVTQIMNVGDNTVGGDYIDEAIREFVIEKHAEENGITRALDVNPGARAKLLQACERAKIQLSDRENVMIYVPDYFNTEDFDQDIDCSLTREELNNLSEHYINRGMAVITKLLNQLNIDQRQVSLCLATGGIVNMPTIKQKLLQVFGIDRLEVSSKGDSIISEGCAWIANDSLRMTLAKPIEVIESRQSYLKVFKSGTRLPDEGDGASTSIDMYCVDPRDGKAKFQIVRPQHVNKGAAADPRVTYDNLVIKVDEKARPFFERLRLDFVIDDNFVVEVSAYSTLTGDSDHCEIFDLEFSLSIPQSNHNNPGSNDEDLLSASNIQEATEQKVRARSNVTSTKDLHKAVPGEVLYTYKPRAFDPEYGDATNIQSDERLYYTPCSLCGRYFNHPDCHCESLLGN